MVGRVELAVRGKKEAHEKEIKTMAEEKHLVKKKKKNAT